MAPRPPVRRLLLLPLLVLACSPVAARRGDTVIMASGADLQSPNPLLTVHPLARQVQRYVLLVTLVRYDSALAPEPYLARRLGGRPGALRQRARPGAVPGAALGLVAGQHRAHPASLRRPPLARRRAHHRPRRRLDPDRKSVV